MADAKRFEVLDQQRCRPEHKLKLPRSVPWGMVEQWRARIESNHGQTLERLNQRGGLCPNELWCGAMNKSLRHISAIGERTALMWLEATVKQWEANRG